MYRCEKCAVPSSHSDGRGRCKVCGSRLSAAPLGVGQTSYLWDVFLALGAVVAVGLLLALGLTVWPAP
jgi:hypothetical protein